MSAWLGDHPEISAVLIALAGFLLALILARLAEGALLRLEALLRHRVGERIEQVDLAALRLVLRNLVYFGTLLVFLLLALQTLGISVVTAWLALPLQYVPQLILGGLIILSGYLLAALARSVLAGLMGVGADHLLPRFAQLLVITAAVLTGLAQMSIDISFISDVLIILLAFFFGGLSLAFALGSRQLVENLLARRALDRYRIGDEVRVGGNQGRVIEILNTAVILETAQGILTVPTSRFVDSEVLLLQEEAVADGARTTE